MQSIDSDVLVVCWRLDFTQMSMLLENKSLMTPMFEHLSCKSICQFAFDNMNLPKGFFFYVRPLFLLFGIFPFVADFLSRSGDLRQNSELVLTVNASSL